MNNNRVQWNKHGKQLPSGFSNGRIPLLIATTDASFICCEKCGAELYGYWEYWKIQRLGNNYSESTWLPTPYKDLNAVFRDKNGIKKDAYENMIEDTVSSMEEIRTGISICPVCNSELDQKNIIKYDRDKFKQYFTNYWAWLKKQASTIDPNKNGNLLEHINKELKEADTNILRNKRHFTNGHEVWGNIILSSRKSVGSNYEFDVSYYGNYKEGFIDAIFDKFKGDRIKKQEEYINNRFEVIESKQDDFVPMSFSSDITKTVMENVSTLKEYIHNVLQIESDYYSVQERLKALYLEAYNLIQKCAFEKGELVNGPLLMKNELTKEINNIEEEIEKVELLTPKDFQIEDPKSPTKPSEPILAKPGLFNKKKIEADNQSLMEEYNRKLVEYNENMKMYQKQLQDNQERYIKEKAEKKHLLEEKLEAKKVQMDEVLSTIDKFDDDSVATPAIVTKRIVEEEIKKAESVLNDLYQGRENIYSCNVVFGKYRNIVAIASFYEYLMAGRCMSLEGVNGAYNIYENEIRLNQIISQLDSVIMSLEQIKENQYVIFSELQNINKTLDSIDRSMDNAVKGIEEINMHGKKIEDYMGEVSNNTAVSAYYSKVNAYYSKKTAQLTNAIGWLVALK